MTNDTVTVPKDLFAKMAVLSITSLEEWAEDYHERNPSLPRPEDDDRAREVVLRYVTADDIDAVLGDHINLHE